jgi:hypothetical protein
MRTFLLLVLATPLVAQLHYPKHYVTFGAGPALPGGDLSAVFDNKPAVSVAYGYRLRRYFQADMGLDAVFGSAGVRDFLSSELGSLRIRDFEYLVPFGGRLLLPLKQGRVMFSGGGGGAYLRYSEKLRQPTTQFRFECPTCTSRSGWGTYALVNASVGIDHFQRFRAGVTSKLYRASVDGGQLGLVAPGKTSDRWVNIFADFTVTF